MDIKTWAGFCGTDGGGLERLVVDRQEAGHSTDDNVTEHSGFGVVSEWALIVQGRAKKFTLFPQSE